jgi:hypothetical protein
MKRFDYKSVGLMVGILLAVLAYSAFSQAIAVGPIVVKDDSTVIGTWTSMTAGDTTTTRRLTGLTLGGWTSTELYVQVAIGQSFTTDAFLIDSSLTQGTDLIGSLSNDSLMNILIPNDEFGIGSGYKLKQLTGWQYRWIVVLRSYGNTEGARYAILQE